MKRTRGARRKFRRGGRYVIVLSLTMSGIPLEQEITKGLARCWLLDGGWLSDASGQSSRTVRCVDNASLDQHSRDLLQAPFSAHT